jgi:hypothetical protein
LRWPDTRCDAIVDRWTLGSRRMPEARSTSLAPTGFSRGQAIRVGLTSTGIRHGNTSDVRNGTIRVHQLAGVGHCLADACERRDRRQSEKRRARE